MKAFVLIVVGCTLLTAGMRALGVQASDVVGSWGSMVGLMCICAGSVLLDRGWGKVYDLLSDEAKP